MHRPKMTQSRGAIAMLLSVATISSLSATMAAAHDDTLHCEAVTQSVADAGFSDVVIVNCYEGQALISSDTYPDHPKMTGIVGTNEQIPVPAADYVSPIPLAPVLGIEPHTRDAALGVAVNGVPIYDYTGGGEMSIADLSEPQDANDTILTEQLDICGGHAGRGDDYHYHATPTCMIAQMPNAGPDAIIGWAFDGFPIYGDDNPDGTTIAVGDLDVCNGQPDPVFGYRYHTSAQAPYIIQCLMGEVADMRDLPRVPPLRASSRGGDMEPGKPPRGGVENLVFTEETGGQRTMTYSYQGDDYYMNYAPSETENCYNVETRRITDDGEVFAGELCR